MTAKEVAKGIFDLVYCEDMQEDKTLYLHNIADAEEMIIEFAKLKCKEQRKMCAQSVVIIKSDTKTIKDTLNITKIMVKGTKEPSYE